MDYAHKQTDKMLEELEESIFAVYKTVGDELAEKLSAYLEKFEEQDEAKRKEVEAGTLTEREYRAWRQRKVEQGKEYAETVQKAAEVAYSANTAAQEIVNDRLPKIYALNQNFINYTMEAAVGFKVGFVNEQTIIRLLRDNPDLFPVYKLIKKDDIRYNIEKIQQTIASGLLQGKPMRDIAKDLQRVADMNRNSAILHAQTAVTGAENAGRQAGFENAKQMGIKFKKVWIATLDGRTRDSHRKLDGQEVDPDEPFRSMYGKIRYPGDTRADPRDVWRCRCSLGTRVMGASKGKRRVKNADGSYSVIEYKTYQEWEAAQRE